MPSSHPVTDVTTAGARSSRGGMINAFALASVDWNSKPEKLVHSGPCGARPDDRCPKMEKPND